MLDLIPPVPGRNSAVKTSFPKTDGSCFARVHQKGQELTAQVCISDASEVSTVASAHVVIQHFSAAEASCSGACFGKNASLVCLVNTSEMYTDFCVSMNKAGIAASLKCLLFIRASKGLWPVAPETCFSHCLQPPDSAVAKDVVVPLHLPSYAWRSSASGYTYIWAEHLEESQSLVGNCPSPIC